MPDTYKWGTVEVLPDGHRLFWPSYIGGPVAIADSSGREPQDTDDGILWLDMDWNLIISSPDNVLCIPVKRDSDGERFSTITDLSTMLHLSVTFDWPIEDQPNRNTIYHVTKEN